MRRAHQAASLGGGARRLDRTGSMPTQGVIFSAFPATIFRTLPRGWPVATFTIVIMSPCLSYREHGLLGCSFQSTHPVFSLMVHVPCKMGPFAVLNSALPSAA